MFDCKEQNKQKHRIFKRANQIPICSNMLIKKHDACLPLVKVLVRVLQGNRINRKRSNIYKWWIKKECGLPLHKGTRSVLGLGYCV